MVALAARSSGSQHRNLISNKKHNCSAKACIWDSTADALIAIKAGLHKAVDRELVRE
jgi:hypothetical protein